MDRGPHTVGFPGTDLGRVGSYRPLLALGVEGKVTSVVGADGRGRIQVVSTEYETACTALTVSDAGKASQLLPMAIEDIFAAFESQDDAGRGTLHIVDALCSEPFPVLSNAMVASRSDRLMPPRLLVLSEEGDLLALDPADRTQSSIDDDVEAVFITFDSVHERAAGQVTIRDMALKRPRHFGSRVTELTVDGDSDAAAYVDDGGLYLVESGAKTSKHLDDDVCQVRFANPPSRDEHGDSRYLAYLSPCADATLTVYDTSKGERISVGSSSSSLAEVRSVTSDAGQQTAVFYMSAEDDGTVLVSIDGGPAAELGPGFLRDIGRGTASGVYLWLAKNTPESRLVRWAPDGSVTEVATGVVDFETETFPERALFDSEEGERSLLLVEGVKEPSIVSSNEATIGDGSYKGTLFGEVDEGDVGTLRLIMAPDAKIETIGKRVYLPTVELAYAGTTLFYLQDYDVEAGAGELCVRARESADTYREPDVLEFLSIRYPERGVAYVKRRGDERHLFWTTIE